MRERQKETRKMYYRFIYIFFFFRISRPFLISLYFHHGRCAIWTWFYFSYGMIAQRKWKLWSCSFGIDRRAYAAVGTATQCTEMAATECLTFFSSPRRCLRCMPPKANRKKKWKWITIIISHFDVPQYNIYWYLFIYVLIYRSIYIYRERERERATQTVCSDRSE